MKAREESWLEIDPDFKLDSDTDGEAAGEGQ